MPLGAWLLVCVALGVVVGRLLGARAEPLGALALVYVKLLKAVAAPLVFCAVADAFARTRLQARAGLQLLGISTMNALVAAAIALGLGGVIPLGRWVDLGALKSAASTGAQAGPAARAIARFGERFVEPLVIEKILYVIAAALVLGLVLRSLRSERLGRLTQASVRTVGLVLGWLVRGVPLVMLGVVARVAGGQGARALPALAAFVALVTAGIALHVLGWYAVLVRVAGRRPLAFLRAAAAPLSTALSAGSSLATLPVTLRTLDEELGVSTESARLAACVGTNLNHDGIILYEAAAALFVAQMYAVQLGLAAKAHVVVTSILAAVGIAGVPEAGFITLSLVLGAAGLPLEAVPLLLPVDWLLGRLRATCNVASDLVAATLLDRFKSSPS